MSDTLNSLLQSQHNSTFMQGVMNPAVLNPLAAQNSAVAAASSVYDLRAKQAEEGWGDALQQATDPKTGVVDYAAAARIAAAKGGLTQMRMMQNLTSSSNLAGQQIDQGRARYLDQAKDALATLYDNSDEGIRSRAEARIRAGYPADQVYASRDALLAMDPKIRAQRAYAHALTVMDPTASIGREVGTSTAENVGGDIPAVTLRQGAPGRPASITRSDTGVTTTLTPQELSATAITVPATQAMVDEALKQGRTDVVFGRPTAIPRADVVSGQGLASVLPPHIRQQYLQQQPVTRPPANVVNPDNTTVSPTNSAQTTRPPVRQLNIPPVPTLSNTNPFTAPPAGVPTFVPGGGPTPSPLPGGVQRPTTPPTSYPPPSVPTSTPPIPAGANPRPPGSRTDLLGGGVQTASANALEAPVTGPPAEPSPLVPGYVEAIQAGMQRARDTPRIPGTQTAGAGYSYGPGTYEDATTKLSGESYAKDKASALDHAGTVLPLAQALSIYGRGGVTTAPGAERWNQIRGWVNGVARSAGLPEIATSTRDWDELNKSLNQIATNVPSSGKSDAQLAAVIAGNASTHIHELVGANKTQANIALIRMAHAMPAEWDRMSPEEKAQYGSQYSNFKRDFNKTFDLRAGAFDAYTPAQKKSLLDDLRAHPDQQPQFWNSVDMLKRNGYLGEQRIIP